MNFLYSTFQIITLCLEMDRKIELMSDHFEQLDYELEFAIVIGKGGKNILVKDENYIAGFCILNDSAPEYFKWKK